MRRSAALLAVGLLCVVAASSDSTARRDYVDEKLPDTEPVLDTFNTNDDVLQHMSRERRQVSVCASQHCQALMSQIKSGGQYSNLNIETSCVNNVCQDEMTVGFFDGSTKVYVCNRNGCSLKGNAPSQNYNYNAVQARPVQNNDDDDIVCKNRPCQALVNKVQQNGGYSNINMHTSCQNSQCDDTVTVSFFDGSRRIYKCNRNGCTQNGNNVALVDNTVDNRIPQTSDETIVCQNQFCQEFINKLKSEVSFSKYNIETTCISDKCEDVITVEYRDNTKDVYTCNEAGCKIKGAPATQAPSRAGPCKTTPCKDYYDKVKAYGKYTTLNVESTCNNNKCTDELTVVFSDGEKRVYRCDNRQCSRTDLPTTTTRKPTTTTTTTRKPTTTTTTTTRRPTTTTVKPRGPCRTSPCQEFYDKVIAYGKYTTLNVERSCKGYGERSCKDLMTVVFSDGERRLLECDNTSCKKIAEPTTTTTTTRRPTTTTTTTTTTSRPTTTTFKPRGPCRTKPCQDFYEKVIAYGKYTMLNVQLKCESNECKDIMTVVFSDGERRVLECDNIVCVRTVEPTTTTTTTSTTKRPTTTTTTTTSTTRRPPPPPPPTTTTTASPTTVGIRGCIKDSDCLGHHICFNGCIDPCDFCGKNALCDVIQRTSTCRCPDDMQGDPNKECTPKPAGGDTNLFPLIRTGCKLPTRGDTMSFCPSRCNKGCTGPGTGCYLQPGTLTQLETVRVQCAPGYGIDDERRTLVPCDNGAWVEEFPKCLALCPPLKSDTMDVQCWVDDRQISCEKSMKPGTKATFRCKQSHSEYEWLAAVYARGIVCNRDGRWNRELPDCKPDCGVPVALNDIAPEWFGNKINGEDAQLGMYPWHAGMYQYDSVKQVWEYFCGGSLVTSRVVITAAHCIATMIPVEIQVALGKVYRSFDHDENTAEKRSVISIKFPPEFNTGSPYTWDVSLLLLNKAIQFSRYVMPVCHNARYTLDTIYKSTAYVAGWGATQLDPSPDILQHTNFSIIDKEECRRQVPTTLFSYDRFCGAKKGTTVSIAQKGDSGGGVTSVFDNKHYIVGVVSLNYKEASIFTNVTYEYIEQWMNRQLFNFEVSSSTKLG